ncbi:MAG: ribonucleotide reductase N-terminal alpha domain-containing protein, partial [Candidatus Pacearchaeota archaeon]
MLERVARSIASMEKDEKLQKIWYEKFLSIMDSLEFLPNSPTLMNAGKKNGQLAACLSGDTIIRTPNGDFTIKELANKYRFNEEFEVYSISRNGEVVIGKSFAPRKTRELDKVYLVTFDDGSILKETLDHLLVTKEGKYKRLKDLKIKDSVRYFSYELIETFSNIKHFSRKIESIKFFGMEPVYDLSVKEHHTFAANNIFVHNCFLLDIQDDLANIFEQVK